MAEAIPRRRRGRPKRREECVLPTPQTVSKLQRDQVSRLLTEGEINPDQERAARKIHSFTMALRRGAVPTSQLRVGQKEPRRRAPASPVEKLNERHAQLWSQVYSPWARSMNQDLVARRPRLTALGLIEQVVNENVSPEQVAVRYDVSQGRVLDRLRLALDQYNAHNKAKNIL